MTETSIGTPAAWLLIHPDVVPAAWASRAAPAVMVGLLPEEATQILSGHPAIPALTGDELAVARLAARGATVTAIAHALGLNRRTVDRRLAGLRRRLGVGSAAELTAALAERGFTTAAATTTGADPSRAALAVPTANGARR
jgi:DNA-binding CsgD family transcriptional regulator